MQYGAVDWNDLRYVLAVARAGSALRAADELGVNQSTVLRRIDALEGQLGAALFERRRTGQTLTAAGQRALEAAERIDGEIGALVTALAAQRRTLEGSVRLTTSESLAYRLVTPCLRAFHEVHPGVSVELIAADEKLDIARGDADLALRAGFPPEGAGIVARRLPGTLWTLYCSRAYAAERGMPGSIEEIGGHPVVGFEGRMVDLPGWRWLRTAAPEAAVRVRSNSMISMIFNLKAGLGVGPLPCIIGDGEAELVRCFPPPPEIQSDLWLIVRETLKMAPHVRAFADFLVDYIKRTMGQPQAA
jgi:DNA-binding transcriptional LysR family regulator